ncbi:MAG TPA: O-antigen polymerase [Ramlibacter sp.]
MTTKLAPEDTGPMAPRSLPWWTRPSAVNLLFILPMLLVVLWAGASDFSGLTIRARSYLSAPYVALCIALVIVSSAGAWLGESMRPRNVLHCADADLARTACGLGVVVLAAYVFWFRVVMLDPVLLWNVLLGLEKPDRTEIGMVAGVTSLVNLSPVFFTLAGYLLFARRQRGWPLVSLTVVLLLLTVFRAYLWSERLALAEVAIPLALAVLSAWSPRPAQRVRRALFFLGPYAALPAVFLFFAVAEFFRSWSYYDARMEFWEFALGRFVSYYYTSLNNGAGMLATMDWPDGSFQHVLLWLHKFPFGIGLSFSDMVGLNEYGMESPPTAAAREFLARYGDPEFNTPSGFLSVTFDLGVPGAMLYYFLTMLASGVLYTRYRRGDLPALMLYPSVLVALFETFRYPYWGQSRAFVWFLGALAVLAVLWASGAIGASKRFDHAGRRSPAA